MCSTDNNSSMNNGMQRDDVGDAFGSFGRSSTVSPLSVAQLAPTQRYATYYNMNHSKRGVALIFNHEFFTVPHLKPRCGTNVDCENLTLNLKNLGFEVNDFHNLTHKDVVKQLERAAEMDHSEHDCLVIAVLSHGELGLLYAHDTAYKADSLWHYFTADKCQSLAGKPKLFFIQACQGDKLDPALCMELRDNGTHYDLLTLLTFVCQRVALDYESNTPDNMAMHQQKQIPCITTMLTRLVKFTSPRNGVI
ncbi:Caspase-1 [Temnothorax longispinosus]|uniref:Caspase-1 n=1 Tax=Temnothorax longispinosus TaxID=300112 RepID=A0A4S2KSH9_9HYME|nr:Caspase-1 [Temnothorax longispinosus]